MKQSFEDCDSCDRAVSVSISQMLIMKYTDIICNIGSIFRNVIKDQKRIKNTFLLITINRLYKNLNEINFCNCFIIANQYMLKTDILLPTQKLIPPNLIYLRTIPLSIFFNDNLLLLLLLAQSNLFICTLIPQMKLINYFATVSAIYVGNH